MDRMERAADTADWVEYYEAQAGREPREFFLDALERVGPAEGRSAVELGSGDGNETRWLLDHGWSVTAVDASPEGVALLRSRTGDRDDLTVVEARLEDVQLPPTDLVYSGFTLPYCPPDAFPALWQRIHDALRPGGWLVANLFGDRDTWASEFEDLTFHTEDQARALLAGYADVDLGIREEDGSSGRGPKHWHVLDVVARR